MILETLSRRAVSKLFSVDFGGNVYTAVRHSRKYTLQLSLVRDPRERDRFKTCFLISRKVPYCVYCDIIHWKPFDFSRQLDILKSAIVFHRCLYTQYLVLENRLGVCRFETLGVITGDSLV